MKQDDDVATKITLIVDTSTSNEILENVMATTYYGIAYGNSTFVAVSYGDAISTSPDGTTWTARTSGTTISLLGVNYGNGIFVATGNLIILTSTDGATCSKSIRAMFVNKVVYGNNIWVSIGYSGVIQTSTDLQTWTTYVIGGELDLLNIIFANNTFIIVGVNGIILTSPDGTTWTARTSGTTQNLSAVCAKQ